MRRFSADIVKAMFLLADFEHGAIFELANSYWPDCEAYAQIRRDNPWFLVSTKYGLVKIGPRKRVYSIEWHDTKIPCEATTDDTTKESFLVHAWTKAKAVEYLGNLRRAFEDHAMSKADKPC